MVSLPSRPDTGSRSTISDPQGTFTKKQKQFIQLVQISDFLREKPLCSAYLSPLQSRLWVLAGGSEWLRGWVEVRVFCHPPRKRHSRLLLRKKCVQTPAKVGLELRLLTTLQRPGLSESEPQISSFFRGGGGR